MRIAIGSDHGGYDLKEKIKDFLAERGHAFVDLGTHDTNSVDYPDISDNVTHYIIKNGYDFGILICGTGQGMAMSANKKREIRAALCTDVTMARLAREHGDCNVLCLGGRLTGDEVAIDIVEMFLKVKFDIISPRHIKRLKKFSKV
jgi:ribose 5-phosphate isomerase B|tara:strand:- start:1291 stop:1728 length:438 start_codon:yes stop_codon:yes gene_type:complete